MANFYLIINIAIVISVIRDPNRILNSSIGHLTFMDCASFNDGSRFAIDAAQ